MSERKPWYSGGLSFTCTQCGKCCTGEPGYVWVTDEEIAAIARFLGEPVEQVRGLYTRKAKFSRTLREKANGDCVFYERDKGCTIYPVRPPQCRTWPFWPEHMSPKAWAKEVASYCPGVGKGPLVPAKRIRSLLVLDPLS